MKFIRPTPISVEGSFTRSTTATYFDVAGVMQTAAIDVPRIGYDPVTHAHTGLMIEAAATNLLLMSADFRSVAEGGAYAQWTDGSAVNAVALNTTSPTGVSNSGSTITWTGTSDTRRANVSVSPNTTVTNFCHLKAGSAAYTALQSYFYGGTAKDAYAVVNWSNNTVAVAGADAANASASITDVGNGWYRVTITHTDTGTNTGCRISLAPTQSNGTTIVTGTVLAWGAEIRASATIDSYIPTTSAAVTRAADVVTGTGLIYSNIPENDYAAWNAATSYTLADRVIRTTTHRVYEKVSAGALVSATLPELDTTNWIEVSPTNKWGALDQQVWSESSAADKIVMILKPGRFNSIALLQVDAANVTVDLNVSGSTVYAASMNLTLGSNVGDWYQYFYEPVYQQDNLVITDLVDAALLDLPAYGEGILTVTISRAAATVSCGVLVVGLYANLGSTQYSPTIGIIDYSRKETDTFGNSIIVPRRYSKRMTAEVMVMQNAVDNVARLLAQYRTTPLVWVGSDDLYTSMIIYGFYKDWEINIANPIQSNLSLQVEGLT